MIRKWTGWRDRAGLVGLIFALCAPALLGVVGLGMDVGMWYLTKTKMQAIADAAALAGDRELAAGTGKVTSAAILSSQLNNCTTAKNCSISTPTTFSTASSPGVTNGVQVVASTTVIPLFAGMFVKKNSNGSITISATGRAAYTTKSTGGLLGCVLGLDGNAAYTVALNNNAILNCNVMSNSKCQGQNSSTCTLDATTYGSYSCSSSIDPQCGAKLSAKGTSSMYLTNNATISATATAAGTIYLSNNATVTAKVQSATQVTNPYSGVTISVPTSTGAAIVAGGNGSSEATAIDISVASGVCSTGSITYSNNVHIHIHPGCYNGFNIQNNAVVALYPGTYIIKSQFVFQNNPVMTGNAGTTLIFAGTGSNSYAISIGNNANLSLVAPTTGTYQGIAMMTDPQATATIVQTFSNNAVLNIKGAIYFPNQILDMENNAIGGGANGCLQLVARRVLLSNNANFGTNCAGVGTAAISIGQQVTKIIDMTQ